MTANKVAEFGAGAKYNAICLSCNRKFLTLASAGGIINYKPEKISEKNILSFGNRGKEREHMSISLGKRLLKDNTLIDGPAKLDTQQDLSEIVANLEIGL
ncbi:unnamed protein product [Ceratitis capitata]|uniref:(Mediterranean fruit fly) hypothetical protein n=1 Tax=Ceratitis capitata TaxID=7213 RepID=A0A811UB31_CERCA|nr:unnamed protein product [Ceratitis capitata]